MKGGIHIESTIVSHTIYHIFVFIVFVNVRTKSAPHVATISAREWILTGLIGLQGEFYNGKVLDTEGHDLAFTLVVETRE